MTTAASREIKMILHLDLGYYQCMVTTETTTKKKKKKKNKQIINFKIIILNINHWEHITKVYPWDALY